MPRPAAHRSPLRRPLLALLCVAALTGCRSRSEVVEASDDPRELMADMDAVCTAMAGGDVYAWRTPLVKSATWNMLISRAKTGDPEANCDAAKLIHRRWKETLTCTASLAKDLASRSRCRLPASSGR
ncbi:MAG: hypothetical protein R3A79_31030 [Nannocystaceae bacterium]